MTSKNINLLYIQATSSINRTLSFSNKLEGLKAQDEAGAMIDRPTLQTGPKKTSCKL